MLKHYSVKFLLTVLLLAVLVTILPVSTAQASTSGVNTQPSVMIQNPKPNGTESVWVDVTRWFRGKALPPTAALLQKIINSYRSGRWYTQGVPVKGADGHWWQQFKRTTYSSGAGAVITWYWRNGCPISKYSWEPGLGGSSTICSCWTFFANWYAQRGIKKPAKCYK